MPSKPSPSTDKDERAEVCFFCDGERRHLGMVCPGCRGYGKLLKHTPEDPDAAQ